MLGFLNRKTAVNETVNQALSFSYDEEEIAAIDRLGTRVHCPIGTAIFTEGKPGHEAVIILAGEVGVYREGLKVATVGAADIVGEAALLTGQTRNASVVAKTEADVVVFTATEFAALLSECPRLDAQMQELISKRDEIAE